MRDLQGDSSTPILSGASVRTGSTEGNPTESASPEGVVAASGEVGSEEAQKQSGAGGSNYTVTYFIQAQCGGPIKIGRAKNRTGVKARLSSLQTGNPEKLEILRILDGDQEADLHKEFADHRLVGEWFAPVPSLVDLAQGQHDKAALTFTLARLQGRREGKEEMIHMVRCMMGEFIESLDGTFDYELGEVQEMESDELLMGWLEKRDHHRESEKKARSGRRAKAS